MLGIEDIRRVHGHVPGKGNLGVDGEVTPSVTRGVETVGDGVVGVLRDWLTIGVAGGVIALKLEANSRANSSSCSMSLEGSSRFFLSSDSISHTSSVSQT